MKIKTFTFNSFQENTYILYDETKECIVIDPGCYTEEEKEVLSKFINNNELTPVKLINTHCHIDHIFGNKYVSEKWNLDLYANSLILLKEAKSISNLYGFNNYEDSPKPKFLIENNQIIKFGKQQLKVLYTPGHSPDHVCLYNKENDLLIAGDLIFKESIGRYDLPGGDYDILINSIKEQIICLPDNTKIFSGHGPATLLEYEKKNNPYLN